MPATGSRVMSSKKYRTDKSRASGCKGNNRGWCCHPRDGSRQPAGRKLSVTDKLSRGCYRIVCLSIYCSDWRAIGRDSRPAVVAVADAVAVSVAVDHRNEWVSASDRRSEEVPSCRASKKKWTKRSRRWDVGCGHRCHAERTTTTLSCFILVSFFPPAQRVLLLAKIYMRARGTTVILTGFPRPL